MLGPFSFVHEGRTYACEVRDGVEGQMWWWFTVSSDGNRYAPFPAASKDTRSSIEQRLVDYYTNHLARRAAPEQPHWAKRGKPPGPDKAKTAAAPAKPAAAAPAKPAVVPAKPAVVPAKPAAAPAKPAAAARPKHGEAGKKGAAKRPVPGGKQGARARG